MPSPDILVRLADVAYRYREGGRERAVLQDVQGEIRRGEYVVLLGQSGSGKTTLLNLVAGLDLPQAGEVSVDGVALNRLGERERTLFRRRRIGFVYQFFNLLPTLSVAENILLPLELIGADAMGGKARELLREVGLAERADSFPDQLSGGEQQRVAVVRALAHDPLLLLADEPTGNLDSHSGEQVLALFDRLIRARGKTLLVATHNREVAARADRVLYLRDGRLSEEPP
ncbi:MAG TPA: ABC transporter ATP-binding protein [Methylococcaceae bacterium]|nr:ABC transporter ATP-binding protein [Methylococcaceae bacterium]